MGKKENTVKSSFDRLAAINRSITTSLNFSEALRLIVVNAAELFSADTSLLLLTEDDGLLRVRASHGLDNDGIPDFSGPMEESVIRNLSRHLKLAAPKELVTVPIVADGSPNGFLAIVRDSQLTSEEHWQLSALADQAAIALNNARLHEFQTGEAVRQRDETLAALRESHRKINAILESITDLYYQLDSEWRFVDVNKRVEEMFRKDFGELVGRVIWEVFPRAIDSDLYPQFHKAVEQRIPVHFELESRIVKGTWFEAHAYPTKTGLSVYLRDITERKRFHQEIAFQAHLLSAVEQAVIATDLDGTIVYWNAFAEKLYGWSATEAVGSSILEVTPADASREQAQEILLRLKEGKSWSGEFVVRRKDGSIFPVMITDSPIFDEQRKLVGVVGVSVDISERKRDEEERDRLHQSEREARAEAEQANRLKDEFLATLSHELRNPLNVILGYAEVLLRSEEARASQFVRRAAEILKRNALAQSRLVRDLLDLSRLHIGKLSLNREVVSLMTIINNAVETVGGDVTAKQIELKVEASEDVVFVNADPLRMEQIIWNLLNNAVKFTPAGGAITIRVRTENDLAVLIVEDTGQGIEPEFLPHVFEMFRQADASSSRPHSGMGIGLALVRQLIDLHGGTIAVDSVVGQGAKFTIQFPVSTETEKSLRVSGPLQAGVLSQMRILVVDDSADTVDMLRQLFEMDGAFVDTARSGVEALEIAWAKDFDVVLSDISMPGMDGFEFVGRLRQIPTQRDVPVIALTGFGRAEDVERARGEGFLSHVTKPIDLNSLVEILRKLPLSNRQIAANAQT
jgi:PAS domain S-box-containing protein